MKNTKVVKLGKKRSVLNNSTDVVSMTYKCRIINIFVTIKGEDGIPRNVWMFPVGLKSGDIPIDEETLQEYEESLLRQARKLTTSEIKQRAEDSQSEAVSIRTVKSSVYIRNPFVSEYIKRIANGVCQLCNERAPFNDKYSNPYLETHHIEWLSNGGADTIENTVAICPNCHRKMQVLNSEPDKDKLIEEG